MFGLTGRADAHHNFTLFLQACRSFCKHVEEGIFSPGKKTNCWVGDQMLMTLLLQGLHDLIASGQVHDVLSHNKLDEKIMGEGWGGITLFQIQNRLYRGVGKIGAGAKVASFHSFYICRKSAPSLWPQK